MLNPCTDLSASWKSWEILKYRVGYVQHQHILPESFPPNHFSPLNSLILFQCKGNSYWNKIKQDSFREKKRSNQEQTNKRCENDRPNSCLATSFWIWRVSCLRETGCAWPRSLQPCLDQCAHLILLFLPQSLCFSNYNILHQDSLEGCPPCHWFCIPSSSYVS